MTLARPILGRMLWTLVIGAAITLTIAWALAMLRPEGRWLAGSEQRFVTERGGPAWFVQRTSIAGAEGIERHVFEPRAGTAVIAAPWWSHARRPPSAQEVARQEATQGDWMITEVAWGWPLPAMRYEYHWRTHPVGFASRLRYFEEMHGGLMASRPRDGDVTARWRAEMRNLPLRPILPGFIGNTLLFAAILLAIQAGWRHSLGAWRRRRGRCALCGYDLRGHLSATEARCPECGAAAGAYSASRRTTQTAR